MNIESKEIEYCKLEVQYQADIDTVKNKRDEAVNKLRKIAIPGFRAGKAPDYAIKSKCKDKINVFVKHEMTTQAYEDIVFETKIKTIGYPQYNDVRLDGNNFSCKMTVLKKPDFELKQHKDFEIPKPHFDRDIDAQVEATIQDLRMRFGEVAPYKDGEFVERGDQVTMDYSGANESGNYKVGEEGILYTIGENKWPGFDDNLLGMSPGEDRKFDLTLLPSTVVKFAVKIHMGMKRIPCPMNDELAQKVGLQNFGEVRQKLAVIAGERVRNQENQMVKQQIIVRLLEAHDFVVPQWLVNMEAQHIASTENSQGAATWSLLNDEEKQVYLDRAIKQVKLSLILDSIRDAEVDAVLSEAELIEVLKNQITLRGMDANKFVVEAQQNGQLFGILAQLKDEYVLQWSMDNSKILE
jgi:trigger factor